MYGGIELGENLLYPSEARKMLKVDLKTLVRYVQQRRIRAIKTPGGHHRYAESDVLAILDSQEKRS